MCSHRSDAANPLPEVGAVPISRSSAKQSYCDGENQIRTGIFRVDVFLASPNRRHPLQRGGRKAWANALKKAGLPFFPIYYLRHTFASRLTSAGVSPLTIAQMLGHSSTQIVPRYAQVLDQNRLDAMSQVEAKKQSAVGGARQLNHRRREPSRECGGNASGRN